MTGTGDSAPEAAGPAPDRRLRRPLLIGLTGPIGCGKSTVAGMLGELGGTVIDADVLARRATDPGRGTLAQIRGRFGDNVFGPNDEMDRAAVAAIVFDDPQALADLERIIHPEVRKMVDELLEKSATDDAPFVVIEAIKLVEGGLAARCDEVWLIECEPETQRARLAARGVPAADAERRLSAQGSGLTDRLSASLGSGDGASTRVRIVSTEGSVEQTRDRIEEALADAFDGGFGRG
jgi:dephospho-CoA kinase